MHFNNPLNVQYILQVPKVDEGTIRNTFIWVTGVAAATQEKETPVWSYN